MNRMFKIIFTLIMVSGLSFGASLSAMDYDQMQENIRTDRADSCATCSCIISGVGAGMGFGYLVNSAMTGAAPALTGIAVTMTVFVSGMIFGMAGGIAGHSLIRCCCGEDDEELRPIV